MDDAQERLSAPEQVRSSSEPREVAPLGPREVLPGALGLPDATHPPAKRKGFWKRHRWLMGSGIATVVVLIAVSVALAIVATRFEPFLRQRIIASLADHFHTRVELDSFHVTVKHGVQAVTVKHGVQAEFGLWATGRGLRIWPPNQTSGDHALDTAVGSLPLIQLQEFSFHVPLRWEQRQFLKIPMVRLKGLLIHVPPRSERDRKTGLQAAINAQARAEQKSAHPDEVAPQAGGRSAALQNVLVEQVVCEQAEVVLETDKPDKLPMTFAIAHLKLRHVMAGEPVKFEAELTNPKPTGQIDTSGSFGPWDLEDPGLSPVNGSYRFQHADLSEFKGIAGILSSNGSYTGTLREITVDGETMVPDFRLTMSAGKLPLHTSFHARVDGTNGDTWLDSVDATLGGSRFATSGKVVRVKLGGPPKPDQETVGFAEPGQQAGHLIDVKVDVPHGRMEDFMRLVSKTGAPSITGVVQTKAALHIPPGDEPVNRRMKLDGYFNLTNAAFTSDKVQARVEELSYRAQGRPDDMKHADPKSVTWGMQGDFHVADAVITLPNLEYTVAGAKVDLHGTYNLDGEVNMDGTARMDATVSQMVGGWKGFLLKPADGFFKKNGAGTQVPIRVRGTREQPDFSVDFGKMGGGTHPERPGEKESSPH